MEPLTLEHKILPDPDLNKPSHKPGDPLSPRELWGGPRFGGSWWSAAAFAVLLFGVLRVGVGGAQELEEAQGLDEAGESKGTRIEIFHEFSGSPESGWWVEVTPLTGRGPGLLHRWAAEEAPEAAEAGNADLNEAEPQAEGSDPQAEEPKTLGFEPQVPPGPAMICFGGPGFGVTCGRHYIYRPDGIYRLDGAGSGIEPQDGGDAVSSASVASRLRQDIEPAELTVTLEPVAGRSTTGRVIQEGFPVVGAQISLVPADLVAGRPFTIPWPGAGDSAAGERTTDGLRRFVSTDDEGQFEIPPVAAGDYVLEAHLPSAQLYRVPFSLPEPDALEDPESPEASKDASQYPFELGDIEVPAGLSLEVRVVDQVGRAIEGAQVLARQGFEVADWTELRARSDAEGWVEMSGLSAEMPVTISCDARGFVSWQQQFELLPVAMECELSQLASVFGSVATADFDIAPDRVGDSEPNNITSDETDDETNSVSDVADLSPPTISISAKGTGAEASSVLSSVADAEGVFALHGLDPGDWSLTLAAPGFEPWVGEISLTAGQTLDLGLIYLPASPALIGRVVTEEDGSPIAGASIAVVEPRGLDDTLSDVEGQVQVTAAGDRDLVLRVAALDRPPVQVVWNEAVQKDSAQDPGRVVELARGGWIRAVVGDLSADGGPCAGCILQVVPPASIRSRSGPVPAMETDSRGEALSSALVPGGYYVVLPRFDVTGTTVVETRDGEQKFVRVEAGEIATVSFDTGRELMRLQLLPTERVTRSQVMVRGTGTRQRAVAKGGGLFELRRDPGPPADVFLLRWNEQTQFEEQIYLGTLGGPLGAVGGPVLGSGAALGVGFESTDPQEVPETVTLELSGSVVIGRLETLSAERLPGVRVRLRDVAGNRFLAEVRSRADGTFRLEDVAPGVYSLVIGERGYQFVSISARRSVDLGAFQLIPGAY